MADGEYVTLIADAAGWTISPATGIELKLSGSESLIIRLGDGPASEEELID